jgi:transposase
MNFWGASSVRRAMPSPKPTPITSPALPDLDAVARFFHAMLARGAVAELLAALLGLLARMRDLNTELVAKLASKSRKKPPSERWRRLQLELPFALAAAANDDRPAPPKPERKKRGPKHKHLHGRPKLPAHLERVDEVHPVAPGERTCPECGHETVTIGYKTAEKLDLRPAEFVVRRVRRETCACTHCHDYAVTAPKQDEVLDRGLLGNELLVQALVDHYDDAVPWERMARSARQQGVPLSANTLAASVGRVLDLFDPVVGHIRERALASSFMALDATGLPVLDAAHPLGLRTGSLWLLEGDHQYAHFFDAPSGHSDHLDARLRGRRLASVMCDGSATNNGVERAGGARGGCHAHARRYLVEALRGGDLRARRGVELYAAIFHVEAESKRRGESLEERFARRQRESAPAVEALRQWREEQRAVVEPKSALGKALGYLRRQWTRLTAFLRDPRMELTNNEVERDLRRWVLARKTWLFVGHDTNAGRAAAALSLLTTCRKMRIEPRRYLRETLAKILAGERDVIALWPETYARALAVERAADGSVRAA